MAWDVVQNLGPSVPGPGTYTVSTVVTNAVSGTPVVTATKTLTIVPAAVGATSTAWRRRFRRYCHWLSKQQQNFSASAGIFAGAGLIPALTTAEQTILAGVFAQLYTTDGYRPGVPVGPAPITPP
jgi:hypothetical protein